jgi:3-deoxy-D-manno-octulosonic-acid transferase
MTRIAYALAWWLATPFILLRLAWRSRRQPGYLERLGERFGRYAPAERVPRVWIHAVSVGETRAAEPLIAELRTRFPQHRILLTHMTPTGRETATALFGDAVERAWLPYDYRFATRRFLAHFAPDVGIVLETEIWPRLLEECSRAGVPAVLANARLSARSMHGYARWPSLTRWALGNFAAIFAQTRDDAQRFAALGAREPVAMGNVKFDLAVPDAMIERGRRLRALFGDRPVWVAGSTRDGEEALLLDAFAKVEPAALLVIVPRHPQRFDEVAALAAARGFALARRSRETSVPAVTRVVIGDSMGEMLAYYAAADVVIMGGSLLPFGSQNLIEACAVGKPVIVGASTFNFEEAAASAIAAGAAIRVADAHAAIEAAAALTRHAAKRQEMGEKARAFVSTHRGAAGRVADAVAALARAR